MNNVCLRGIEKTDSHTLAAYESIGGYQVWRQLLNGEIKPEEVIKSLKDSGLKGRGGAGFLTGLKWQFMNRDEIGQKYLICNSDEGEPGTCKDTLIMLHNPHQLIEGMAICAYVIGASVAYNYIRGEYFKEFERCESALKEALETGLLGNNILSSGFDLIIHNLLGAGSYIVGEETAMMESIEGKRAMPRNKPPFPAVSGLYGKPTTINNTETLASVPVILEKGEKWFRELGTEGSGGVKIFCVSGHVRRPGVYELPLGTPFKQLLEMCGGVRQNRKIKAVIPGGTSMRVLPGHAVEDLTLDFDALSNAGSAIGSGGIIVMDETTCMVEALRNMMAFYHHESCGQCTPCREGSGWIMKILDRVMIGKANAQDVDQIKRIAQNIEGNTICAFGEAISWPVTSFIEHFVEEFIYYATHGHSMVSNANLGFSWQEHLEREQ